jgi:endonuclease/exonuclease/phosphatase (EEP) superfamily protein YafD
MSVMRWIVAAVVVVVGLATLVGLLDRFAWIFEIADVFRLQYLVLLVAAGLAAVALRQPHVAAIAAVLAAVNVAVLGIPLSDTATATANRRVHGSLRLVVANVEVGNTDYAAVAHLVEQTRPDLLGVIELSPAMARHLSGALPGYRARVIDPRDDAYGIGVYSRVALRSAQVERFPARDGPPSLVASVDVAGKPVSVVVTHVHTPFAGSVHVRHLRALAAARPRLGDRAVICGDFNTPPWSGPLRKFARSGGFHDLYGGSAWRGYSWPTWSSVLRVPLDNCFTSPGVVATDHGHGADVGSDHRPLVVDLAITQN